MVTEVADVGKFVAVVCTNSPSSRLLLLVGSADVMVTRVVDVGTSHRVLTTSLEDWIAEGIGDTVVDKGMVVLEFTTAVCIGDADTRGAARPKTKRRWLQVFSMLYCCTLGLMPLSVVLLGVGVS